MNGQPSRGAAPPIPILFLALWLALAAGVAEGLVRLTQSLAFGKVIGVSPHIIWTAPLANLAWIGVPALLLAGMGRLLRWPGRQRITAFVLVGLAVSSLALLYPSMHKAVTLFLSAAIGWKLSGWMLGSPRFSRLAHRSVPMLVGAAVLGGLLIAGSRRLHERRLLTAAPAAGLPNVLLIVLDTVRDENMSVSGYGVSTTPFLERFAAEGTRFERAMSTAPWTLPAHASMFTGRLPAQLKAAWRTPLQPRFAVVAESFGQAGYRTGGFTANMAYTTREHGLARGFGRYEDYDLSPVGILASSRMGRLITYLKPVRRALGFWDIPGRKTAEDVNRDFTDWMEDGGARPFFAFLNYFDAHQPYLPEEPYRSKFVKPTGRPYEPTPEGAPFDQMTAPEIQTELEHYNAGIAQEDAALAALMEDLRRRGLLDRTLVIITSDHGEQFGEHRKMAHGNSLYRQVLEVPLLMRLPGAVPAELVVEEPVSIADLARTMLGLAGQADTARYPGASLARFWEAGQGAVPEAPVVSIMYGPGGSAWSFIDGEYHYLHWFREDPELYALDDEQETRNLASAPGMQAQLDHFANLRASYARQLSDQGRSSQ